MFQVPYFYSMEDESLTDLLQETRFFGQLVYCSDRRSILLV